MTQASIAAGVGIFLVVVAGAFVFPGLSSDTADTGTGLETFDSAEAFRTYLANGRTASGGTFFGTTTEFQGEQMTADRAQAMESGGDGGTQASPSRYSETNVQEAGVDEPDIVKTDGSHIYFARRDYRAENTSIIDAFPPRNASVASGIEDAGQLFLDSDTLLVLSERGTARVTAYDVSDPSAPQRDWRVPLNGTIVSARMQDGRVYLVIRDSIDRSDPCPVRPATTSRPITIPCDRVYHPVQPVDADVTYTVLTISPETGAVQDTVSFVGTRQHSVVYMSQDGLYITYTREKSRGEILMDYLTSEGRSLLDSQTAQRIETVKGYDLSQRAKLVEVMHVLEQYQQSLEQDERRTFQTRLQNGLSNYTQDHAREFQTTGITKVALDELSVEQTGTVPGRPLNQFSLDTYQGNLRIATTVDPGFGRGQSANDLYVLNGKLNVRGSVKDMGLNEEIYSVRFIGDTGYVVTFRRIDPFHVLDLSDPDNPVLKGELKLPGFSSYLHPLPGDRILGIGEEDRQVKTVIFDVSDSSNPTVQSDYILDEHWSAISESHHAFLHDEKHGVFFIPASRGGYIFSYQNGLTLEKAVDMKQPQRAVYIDDYLYILGESEMVVLDETTWNRVKTLQLGTLEPDYRHPYIEEPRLQR